MSTVQVATSGWLKGYNIIALHKPLLGVVCFTATLHKMVWRRRARIKTGKRNPFLFGCVKQAMALLLVSVYPITLCLESKLKAIFGCFLQPANR